MSSIQLQDRNNWCCSVVRITIESLCVLPAGPLSPHGSKDPHSILIPVHVTCQRALQITPGFREPSTVNRQWRHVKDCRSAHLQFRLRLRALETGEREGQSKPRLREGKRPGRFPRLASGRRGRRQAQKGAVRPGGIASGPNAPRNDRRARAPRNDSRPNAPRNDRRAKAPCNDSGPSPSQGLVYSLPSKRSIPSRIVKGWGGQPGIQRSTGMDFGTPSPTSGLPAKGPPLAAQAPTAMTSRGSPTAA